MWKKNTQVKFERTWNPLENVLHAETVIAQWIQAGSEESLRLFC